MAKIGTAHIEIKPVVSDEVLTEITDRIADAVADGVARGMARNGRRAADAINASARAAKR